VTNHHVVARAHKVYVMFTDGEKVDVVGVKASDRDADISILKLARRVDLQPLHVSESSPPAVGTRAYAIGSPLGLTNTLSEGLVSGVRPEGAHDVIQTSAPISPGSSGGPLLTAKADVVGVTTFVLRDGQNLNFAVPSSEVVSLLRRAEKQKQLMTLPLDKEDTAVALLKSGNAWLKRKEYVKAIGEFDQAIRLDPKLVSRTSIGGGASVRQGN
jgi:S1-C subfamily serine protease